MSISSLLYQNSQSAPNFPFSGPAIQLSLQGPRPALQATHFVEPPTHCSLMIRLQGGGTLRTILTPCQALCWVRHTNYLSCATNSPGKGVTMGSLILQMRKLPEVI